MKRINQILLTVLLFGTFACGNRSSKVAESLQTNESAENVMVDSVLIGENIENEKNALNGINDVESIMAITIESYRAQRNKKNVTHEPEFSYVAYYKDTNLLQEISKGKLDWKDLDWLRVKHVFELTVNENEEIAGDIMKYMFLGDRVVPARYRLVSNVNKGVPFAIMLNASDDILQVGLLPNLDLIVVVAEDVTQVFTNNKEFLSKSNAKTQNNNQQK